jgi:hypothetical protein
VGAGFSLSAALTYTVDNGIRWSLVLPGTVIVLSGFQVQSAARLTRRLAPDRLRTWMVALPIVPYVLGGACIVLGLWALASRGAAI